MKKKLIVNNLLLGFLSWLIPFVVSFFFYKPGGELVVPYATFKSIIILVGIVSGCILLFRYFNVPVKDFTRQGAIVGVSWLVLNIMLDALMLIPMMKTSFADYFMSVGISYIGIPAMSITMGCLLDRKLKK